MAVKECCVKLSLGKKSIFGAWSQVLFLLLFVGSFSVSATETEISCTNVKNIFERRGMLSSVDIQELPNSDAGGLCTRRGCCGASARARLTQLARPQLEAALRSELAKLADVLTNRANRFDEFFRRLLQLSRDEFHAMFKRTYGMIYERHSYVFEQLFEQLERYYSRGDTDFDSMMNGFFGILYEKMFTVLNAQYTFDEKYLKCVNEHMPEIQPFEDVPHKLSVQLRRAFVATRTFHKALRAGADIVRNMIKVGVSQECVSAWARLRFCGACGGQEPPACIRYCHNVIKGCLPVHADLGDQWDAYVDAVEKVADRLLGPFNIAMVVEPIDIKISEAIMSFQEHNQEISHKIFTSCGKPALGGTGGGAGAGAPFYNPDRSRRSVRSAPDLDWTLGDNEIGDFEIETFFDDPALPDMKTADDIRRATADMEQQAQLRQKFLEYMRGEIELEQYEKHERSKRDAQPEAAPGTSSEIDFRSYEFDGKKGSKKKKPAASKPEDGYELLVREARSRLRSSRRYWSHLPVLLCSPVSVTSLPCFNGSDVAVYSLNSAGEGSAALASNPEVRGGGPDAVGEEAARAQQEALRALTARLKDAYNGVEVQWTDADDLISRSSSSDFADSAGSGSGSGDDTDDITDTGDLPDDDEDRESATDYEGSGSLSGSEDDDVPTETETEVNLPAPPPPPQPTEDPFTPSIVGSPGTNNVNVRVRMEDVEPPPDSSSDKTEPQSTSAPASEQPVTDSADRPSLHRALFTYALPVVCAWFGTIVTDIF